MSLVLALVLFIGCYLLYTNSEKTVYRLWKLERGIRSQKTITKIIGKTFLVVTLSGFLYGFGFAGGIFFFLLVLMTAFSLLVVLRPMLNPTSKHAGK